MRLATGIVLALAFAMPAGAQTQADMNAEVGAKYRAADAALNALYRAAMAHMAREDAERATLLKQRAERPDGDPGYRAALLASQRAWLAYRDAQCTLASFEFRGGSAQGMSRGVCLTDLTRARTAELAALLRNLSSK